MDAKARAAYEEFLKRNEEYPLNSLATDERVRHDEHVKRSEAAKKAAQTRKDHEEES